MKLLNDATSPFGRKVLVAALERSIPIVEEFVDLAKPAALGGHNPLQQIPTLLIDGDRALYDSDTILLYFNEIQTGVPLIPDRSRWQRLTRVSLANGLMEAVLSRVLETRRPDDERSPKHIGKMEARIDRVIARFEQDVVPAPPKDLYGDDIAVACALDYVNFRYGTDWRAQAPRLATWLEGVASRDSMQKTVPSRSHPIDLASDRQP